MKFDILDVPFSYKGSFWAFSTYEEESGKILYLKNVRESCSVTNYKLFRIKLIYKGIEIGYTCSGNPQKMTITTSYGNVYISFCDRDSFVVQSDIQELEMEFYLTFNGGYSYSYRETHEKQEYILLNLPQNRIKMALHTTKGETKIKQEKKQIAFSLISGESGLLGVVQEIEVEWEYRAKCEDFQKLLELRKIEFEEFTNTMLPTPDTQEESRLLASYILWSCHVKKSRFLTGEAIYMSKNDMCNIWSWDNCMNAIAMSYGQQKTCLDQLMIPLDYQDEHGSIPDLVNDVFCLQNFCKPPIYGWAIQKISQNMTISDDIMKILYEKVGKNTDWWFNYRDSDRDYVCEYLHGNDSGWDNSTLFMGEPPVETPDLQTFLILQMDFLIEYCDRYERVDEKIYWEELQAKCLDAMIRECFIENYSVAKRSGSHEVTREKSLICYIPLMLGDRLPKEIRDNLLKELIEGEYLTEYGLATEPTNSIHYRPNGYWRGPIWGISTLMISEGLEKNGYGDLAKEIARRFADLVKKSGMAENFNAITGDALKDKAFTWTSACYFYMSNRYLLEETERSIKYDTKEI